MPKIPLNRWPQALADEATPFAVRDRWFGRQVRSDRWNPQLVRHPWQTLYFIQEGACEAKIGDAVVMLEPGTLVWWPELEPITLHWPPRFVFSEIWFTLGDFQPPIAAPLARDAWETLPLFDACADAMRRPSAHQERRLRHFLAIILLEFDQQPSEQRGLTPAQRQLCVSYVQRHLERRISAHELADAVGLSEDYFARRFQASYGRSPRRWMVEERIHYAARLLRESTDPVHIIADRLGYGNVAQFCRQFHEIIGRPPGIWRRSAD
jgi:AraC-like DNA-binding protein